MQPKPTAIAHATKRTITERMEEDPAFYRQILQADSAGDRRLQEQTHLRFWEYLNRVTEIRDKVAVRKHDDLPTPLVGNEDAMAYYGVLKPFLRASRGPVTKSRQRSPWRFMLF